MVDILVKLAQIIIGLFAIISATYTLINFFVKLSRQQLITFNEYSQNFSIIEKQIELLKQSVGYQNQLILEKLEILEKQINDIENWLDKQDNLTFVKRRR